MIMYNIHFNNSGTRDFISIISVNRLGLKRRVTPYGMKSKKPNFIMVF